MKLLRWVCLMVTLATRVHACIWDADTMFQERHRHHDLASAILGEPPAPADPQKLQERIKELEANRNETNADWRNNLAGAYLRLNQPEMAVKLLEPEMANFTNDYGMHANLGTAYHLLGRYADAEKEIARDLEINPEAHFGLEKYHLALLQYLVRDKKYQGRHVYVDELTSGLCVNGGGHFYSIPKDQFQSPHDETLTNLADLEGMYDAWITGTNTAQDLSRDVIGLLAASDEPPKYRSQWDLAADTNLTAGVIYMAEMNPKEPACFTMLGIAAWKKRDFNLAVAAFEKAIALGSPQPALLQTKIDGLNRFIKESHKQELGIYGISSLIPLVILYYLYTKIRDWRRRVAVGGK